LPVYLLTALIGASAAAGMALTGLRFAAGYWLPIAFAAIGTFLEAWALWLALCLCFTLLTFALAAHPHRFVDAELARADSILFPFFDWPKNVALFASTHAPLRFANWVYESIRWQPTLLLIILSVAGRYRAAWRFVLTWNVALTIVVVIFAFAPGLGAYAHFGIAHAEVPGMRDPTPWHQVQLLRALDERTLTDLRPEDLDGLVTFPSFHAAAAVVLGATFWQVRLFRWPMAVLNLMMLLAAIPVGGHYLIDIAAGVVTAIVALVAVNRALSLDAVGGRLAKAGVGLATGGFSRSGAV
jgi:membrane-associated phospholipid phosphatase